MKKEGIWKKTLAIATISITISATLFGCAYHSDLTYVKPEIPDGLILDRLPLKAALYIPESTRHFTKATNLSTRCQEMHVTGPYGRIFAGTVEGTFKQVFQDLTVVSRPAGGRYDILVEADMTDYIYKAGCTANPGSFGIVKGHIRAMDGTGKVIWRSKETEKRSGFTGSWEEFVPESMASLVGSWAQEMTRHPKIRKLLEKKQ
jgi:hypothetical protein